MEESKIKVLLFPWLAHGHISPFLELAKALCERKHFDLYLCSTRVNLDCIEKKLTEKYVDSIKLVELRLPSNLSDLPPQYHTTKDLPPQLMDTLKKAFNLSTPSFSSILTNLKPNIIIYDFLQSWASAFASRFNIPSVVFITTSAAMTSLKLHYHKKPGLKYPYSNIYNHGLEDDNISCMFMYDNEKKDPFLRSIKSSKGMILVKSSREIEGKYVDYLSKVAKKKIVLLGPLVQNPSEDDDGKYILDWLDKKEENSTVFVTFGSEYFLTKDEIEEVAYGLELSGVNFIWVVRCPLGEKSRIDDALSKEFFDKIQGKGLIIQGWAPQAKILNHPNIGGFVSHCGWSSVMEGINSNVPIIAVPMHIDQPINARILEEARVGVQVKRAKNGMLDRNEIAKAIKDVIKGGKGKEIKKNEEILNKRIRVEEEKLLDELARELEKLGKKKKGYRMFFFIALWIIACSVMFSYI